MMTKLTLRYGILPRQFLDLYLGEEHSPVIVYVHGGAWQHGDKSDVAPLITSLLAQGFSVASINYRLAPANPWPAAQDDLEAALAYLNATAFHPAALLGISVGGTMALISAGKHHLPVVTWSAVVEARQWVAAHATAHDVQSEFCRSFLKAYLGDLSITALARIDPLLNVKWWPGQTLMFNATDELVPVQNALHFCEQVMLRQRAASISLLSGHEHAQAYWQRALPGTIAFYKRCFDRE